MGVPAVGRGVGAGAMTTSSADLHWIANYIWGIADDVLRDLYVRGKYRDVILPMAVLRRFDAVLEDTKPAVLDMKRLLDGAGAVEQDSALRAAAGQAFYNTSPFTLRDLRARASRQRLEADFRAWLVDGFSPNVQDILDNFEFRNQIPRLSKADALGTLIEKLTSPDVNLGPAPVKDADGAVRHSGLDNHGMGSIFEELERMGGKKAMRDPRFVTEHAGDPEYSLVTRSSDGQMLFLANKLSKMKRRTRLGSRIAEVHNGSSLFTGDAGQGESNIRRWIIENDWLEAIVALPPNMFYNTGIATYVWVLTNRKPEPRRGKVQLIDATRWFRPLRKNLGKKNCELGDDDIARICDTFLAFEETAESRIFDNAAFGYWKVAVDRPLRIEGADPDRVYRPAEIKKLKETGARSGDAPPLIRTIHEPAAADPLRGRFAATVAGRPAVVEYEPDPDLRDTEQIPLQEEGGIEAFLRREVLPYAADAWYRADSVKVGYEISFTRYFYKPKPLRTLVEIRADILALERETEGLLDDLLVREPRAAHGSAPASVESPGLEQDTEGAAGQESRCRRTTGDDDMTEITFEVTQDEVDGGYSASALGYSIHTQGDSVEEIRSNVKEAVDCHFDESMTRPKLIRLHFVRDEVLRA